MLPAVAFPGTIYQITSSLQPDIKNMKQLAFLLSNSLSLEVMTGLSARAGKARRDQCAPACPSIPKDSSVVAVVSPAWLPGGAFE